MGYSFGALARAYVQNDPRRHQKCAGKKLFLVQHMFEPDNFMSYVYIYIYGVDVCIGLLYVGVGCAHTVYTELNLVSGAKLICSGTTQTMHVTHMWSQQLCVRCINTPIWGVYVHICMVYVCVGR